LFWCAASVSYTSYWYAKLDDPCSIADKLPNGYQSLLVVVIVVAVMPNDYHMVVVATVVAVMPIWLRKSTGYKEHKQDKH
jgi:ABC-type antimicrobial peptide transport system permease subunit